MHLNSYYSKNQVEYTIWDVIESLLSSKLLGTPST